MSAFGAACPPLHCRTATARARRLFPAPCLLASFELAAKQKMTGVFPMLCIGSISPGNPWKSREDAHRHPCRLRHSLLHATTGCCHRSAVVPSLTTLSPMDRPVVETGDIECARATSKPWRFTRGLRPSFGLSKPGVIRRLPLRTKLASRFRPFRESWPPFETKDTTSRQSGQAMVGGMSSRQAVRDVNRLTQAKPKER